VERLDVTCKYFGSMKGSDQQFRIGIFDTRLLSLPSWETQLWHKIEQVVNLVCILIPSLAV